MKSIHSQDRHWDPFFAVLQETGLPLCMHYGSSSTAAQTAPDAPYLVSLAANSFILPISTTLDWIFSGNLGRFPGLKDLHVRVADRRVAPTLERAEYVLGVHQEWTKRLTYTGTMPTNTADRKLIERDEELFVDERSPTQICKDQIYACFFNDIVGLRAIREPRAIDNIMIEMPSGAS